MIPTYRKNLLFADADADLKDAEVSILGVPYDRSSSFRTGQRFAPNAIREASWNFETFMFEHGIDLKDIPVHDMGNIDDISDASAMLDVLSAEVRNILLAFGKVPLLLGGEHTITIGALRAYRDLHELPTRARSHLFGREDIDPSERVGVVVVDAHLDSRDSYHGDRFSHACVTRRVGEVVGNENVLVLGVRSISREEMDADGNTLVDFISSYEIKRSGIDACLRKATNMLRPERVYLSIDLDGIDPAYAPGVSTPEPFGITPDDVKTIISAFGERLIGADIVELTPSCDATGVTSALASRLAREVIAVLWKNRRPGVG